MASKHHKIIKQILDDLIKEYANTKPFPFLEKETIIKINDPESKSKHVIEYNPDYAIKRNISKHAYYLIIFEIIDEQNDIKTMADIARILAKSEIRKAIFISCNEIKKDETDRIVSVLIGSYTKIFNKKSKKDILNLVSRDITGIDDCNEIRKIILKEINEFLPKRLN